MPDIFVASPKKTTETAIPAPDVTKDQPVDAETPSDTSNRVHLFSAFTRNPYDISFQNQAENEKVILFIRRSFFTNIKWLVMGLFLLIIPLLIFLTQGLWGFTFLTLPPKVSLLFIAFYYLLLTTYFYVNYITWYFNISLVTDKNVIDVDFSGLVFKNVAATKISLVQDVSYAQIGVVRNFFDFGDVLVQTAGTLENFTFEAAPKPQKIVHIIESMIGKRYERT
jgi:hypothetical protein